MRPGRHTLPCRPRVRVLHASDTFYPYDDASLLTIHSSDAVQGRCRYSLRPQLGGGSLQETNQDAEFRTKVRAPFQSSPFTPLSRQFRFRAMAHRPHPLRLATEEMPPDGSSVRYRCSPATANPDANSVPAQHNMRVYAYLGRIRLRSYSRLEIVVQGTYDPVRQHAAVCRAERAAVLTDHGVMGLRGE